MKETITAIILCLLVFSTLVPVWAAADYRLGSEDVLRISVLRHEELSGEFYIPADGILDIPAVGPTKVAGKTLQEVKAVLTSDLRKRLRNPEVSVTLKQARISVVYVLGPVGRPGPMNWRPGWRITEAVAAAGGVAERADVSECKAVILRSSTGEKETVRLADALRAAPEANLTLNPGDVLTVEPYEEFPIYVLGYVGNPGVIQCRAGWRIAEALAAAGGVREGINITDCSITLLDGNDGERKKTPLSDILSGMPEANILLSRGDLIKVEVPEQFDVYVIGEVSHPGVQRLRKDSDGLAELLSLAGGTTSRAATSRVTITHTDGKSEVLDITPLVRDGVKMDNIKLNTGDIVTIPENAACVAVLGWVNNPGYYPLPDGKKLTISEAIMLARGYVRGSANTGQIALIRTVNGKIERRTVDLAKYYRTGDPVYNPLLQDGDAVYITKDRSLNWNVITQALSSIVFLRGFMNSW